MLRSLLQLLGLVLIVHTAIFSQDSKSTLTIAGQIVNYEEGKELVLMKDRWHIDKPEIKEDGAFYIQTPSFAGGMIYMFYDQLYTEVMVHEDDSIFVTINPADEELAFSGIHAGTNNYLFGKSRLQKEINHQQLFQLPRDSFEMVVKELKKKFTDLLDKHSADLGASFWPLEEDFLDLYFLNLEADYYAGQKMEMETKEMTAQIRPFLKDERLMIYSWFKGTFLYSDYKKRVLEKVKENIKDQGNPVENITAQFQSIQQTYDRKKIRDYLFYIAMRIYVINHDDGLDEVVTAFQKYCTNSEFHGYIDQLIQEKRSKIAKGKPAPPFTLPDVNGKLVSLQDFRGKVVFIDFWATWCAPCIKELPDWKKLKKEFKDQQDLIFLSISIDEDVEKWKNYVHQNNMDGVQLIAEQGRESSVNTEYTIGGIPRYVLIDRTGKIIDGSAPRPGTTEIR